MSVQEESIQAANWSAAQSISFSIPLIPAALQQLRLLTRVDAHRCLYKGPAVSRAVQRYEECWLPLLALCKDGLTPEGYPLQPPLDCAWIWHCHRLNPLIYARDCKLLYDKILGTLPHVDSVEAIESTKKLWQEHFPKENYELDLSKFHYDDQWQSPTTIDGRKIKYNLEEAVIRQKTFYYQVSQPHMKEESFLRAAEQRYKGFLHLFRLTNNKFFLVPTYDIDLMWHAHQLDPEAYARDLTQVLGRVLEHDDTDSDRNPGQKLDVGFHKTCHEWQQSYGGVYERAGAMYRGEPPAPIELTSVEGNDKQTTVVGAPFNYTPIAPREVMQVSLTIIKARDLPTKKRGSVRVRLELEKKCSAFRLETVSNPLLPEVQWNHSWTFQAEKSTHSFVLTVLRKRSYAIKQKIRGSETLGQMHIPWQNLLSTPTLSYNGWCVCYSNPKSASVAKPPSLLISVSLTPPQPAPLLFRTINAVPTNDYGHMDAGGFLKEGHKCWLTRTVLDHANNEVFIVRARYSDGRAYVSEASKCIYIHQGGWFYADSDLNTGKALGNIVVRATHEVMGQESQAILSMQRCWGFFENTTQLVVRRNMADSKWNIRPLLELRGSLQNSIALVCGRKLEYAVKFETEEEEGGFVTLIRYGLVDAPLGKATALFNWRTGAMEVVPEESVVLVLLLSSIISMSVFDMEGLKVDKSAMRRYSRSRPLVKPSDEWGSVVMTSRNGALVSRDKSMMPYYCWWDMSPIIWASYFYTSSNVMYGASGCGAAGACGAGACGGSACGGGSGGACGGGGGCGGGGCGGGGCGGGCGG